MRQLASLVTVATLALSTRALGQVQDPLQSKLFVVCEARPATVGGIVHVNAVNGYTGMSFGITYLNVVVDTAGHRKTLVYNGPVSVWRHSAQFMKVEWLPTDSISLSDLMRKTTGKKKWPNDLRFEFEQWVKTDGVVIDANFNNFLLGGAIPTQMETYCDK